MTAALILAVIFTVILLVITAYFFMGSLPLLVLKHDTPLDSRFVRGFFDTYYLAVMFSAGIAALGYALAGRVIFTVGATGLAVLATGLRRTIIPKMDAFRTQIEASEVHAIAGFRRLHMVAISANLAQLVAIVWSLIAVSLQMK